MKPEPVDIMLSHQANYLLFDQALKELSTSGNLNIVTDKKELLRLLRDETTDLSIFLNINMPSKIKIF